MIVHYHEALRTPKIMCTDSQIHPRSATAYRTCSYRLRSERAGVFRPDLDQYTQRNVVRVLVPVWPRGVDGRGRNRYRNSDLRDDLGKSDTVSQIRTTYVWTTPGGDARPRPRRLPCACARGAARGSGLSGAVDY